jgi:hypothetical protein
MSALVPVLAAATWTDAIVIAAVLLGCAIALAGIASFDPRYAAGYRSRCSLEGTSPSAWD